LRSPTEEQTDILKSTMDNPEKQATLGTQDEDKQNNKNTTQKTEKDEPH
jgi:hypothetical protein